MELFRTIYDFFAHGTKLTYAAMGVGLFMAVLYFGIFFRGFRGFKEDANNANKLFPGVDQDNDYVEDQWAKNKILLWIMISVGCGFLAYHQLPGWFPHWFGK